jgi:hypothetical protein
MNRIWHAFLQLIFNGRRPKEHHVFFNDFSCSIESITASVDGCRRFCIDIRPLSVFCFGNLA